MKRLTPIWALACMMACQVATSQDIAQQKSEPAQDTDAKAPKKNSAAKPPTEANLPYGDHERQVLDFWKAESPTPTPLLFFIHGGGWTGGDKGRVANLDKYLEAGVSVVSINYRYVTQAHAAGIKPPVKAPLHDAARALQFVRHRAKIWNIDPDRVAASGGSAGACSSLWLAFHDDMAEPESNDPIARQSTRLSCAAVSGAQTSLDPQQMREWIPNSNYGSHAFGIFKEVNGKLVRDFDTFFAQRERIQPWIAEYSPYALVTKDDPPIYLIYNAPPAMGKEEKDPTHSANFGVKLQERLASAGVPVELVYPNAPGVKHPQMHDFVIDQLR